MRTQAYTLTMNVKAEVFMNKLKLMTIVGTRPEIIRLSEIIKKCDLYFDHILVHSGQNYDYELNQIFFDELNLRAPDYYLNAAKDNLGRTIGEIIAKSYELMVELQPEAILVLGDTNTALCTLAAKRLKIPIFHMEAGNRCFDENLPEETNRRIVDQVADVNLCYTEHARRYLNREGRPMQRTYVTGSPITEVLSVNKEGIDRSRVLEKLGLEERKYILLSAHREENIDIDSNFDSLVASVNALTQKYNLPVIYSMHPRSRKMIEKRGIQLHPLVRPLIPFGFLDYNCLQRKALCVVSDSGTLPEEANFFKFPAVSIRTSTERPEALEKGNFIMGGIGERQILNAVAMAIAMNQRQDTGADVPDYTDINVSQRIVNIIQSYTNEVNLFVWRKNQ